MKETLGNVIVELEKAVKPLGFEIESVVRKDDRTPIPGVNFRKEADGGQLNISLVRHIKCLSMDGVSESVMV
jgi:hypothetical protein